MGEKNFPLGGQLFFCKKEDLKPLAEKAGGSLEPCHIEAPNPSIFAAVQNLHVPELHFDRKQWLNPQSARYNDATIEQVKSEPFSRFSAEGSFSASCEVDGDVKALFEKMEREAPEHPLYDIRAVVDCPVKKPKRLPRKWKKGVGVRRNTKGKRKIYAWAMRIMSTVIAYEMMCDTINGHHISGTAKPVTLRDGMLRYKDDDGKPLALGKPNARSNEMVVTKEQMEKLKKSIDYVNTNH